MRTLGRRTAAVTVAALAMVTVPSPTWAADPHGTKVVTTARSATPASVRPMAASLDWVAAVVDDGGDPTTKVLPRGGGAPVTLPAGSEPLQLNADLVAYAFTDFTRTDPSCLAVQDLTSPASSLVLCDVDRVAISGTAAYFVRPAEDEVSHLWSQQVGEPTPVDLGPFAGQMEAGGPDGFLTVTSDGAADPVAAYHRYADPATALRLDAGPDRRFVSCLSVSRTAAGCRVGDQLGNEVALRVPLDGGPAATLTSADSGYVGRVEVTDTGSAVRDDTGTHVWLPGGGRRDVDTRSSRSYSWLAGAPDRFFVAASGAMSTLDQAGVLRPFPAAQASRRLGVRSFDLGVGAVAWNDDSTAAGPTSTRRFTRSGTTLTPTATSRSTSHSLGDDQVQTSGPVTVVGDRDSGSTGRGVQVSVDGAQVDAPFTSYRTLSGGRVLSSACARPAFGQDPAATPCTPSYTVHDVRNGVSFPLSGEVRLWGDWAVSTVNRVVSVLDVSTGSATTLGTGSLQVLGVGAGRVVWTDTATGRFFLRALKPGSPATDVTGWLPGKDVTIDEELTNNGMLVTSSAGLALVTYSGTVVPLRSGLAPVVVDDVLGWNDGSGSPKIAPLHDSAPGAHQAHPPLHLGGAVAPAAPVGGTWTVSALFSSRLTSCEVRVTKGSAVVTTLPCDSVARHTGEARATWSTAGVAGGSYTWTVVAAGVDGPALSASGGSVAATGTVTVGGSSANRQPVALDASAVAVNGEPVAVPLSGYDLDHDTLTWEASAPAHGAVAVTEGQVVYTPHAGFRGTDAVTLTASDGRGGSSSAKLSLTSVARNRPPVPTNPTVTVAAGETVSLTAAQLATDPEGAAVTLAGVGHQARTDGVQLSYQAPSRPGYDEIDYYVADPTSTTQGTLSVTVTAADGSMAPKATSRVVRVREAGPTAFSLPAVDPDSPHPAVEMISPPRQGTVTLAGLRATYTPSAGFDGRDDLGFCVTDEDGLAACGWVYLQRRTTDASHRPTMADLVVTTVEDVPVTLQLSGQDPDGDPLTYRAFQPVHGLVTREGGMVTYTPDPGFAGSDSFLVRAVDPTGHRVTARVFVSVGPLDQHAPVAEGAAISTVEDTPRTLTLHATDADGDKLRYTVADPPHGTASVVGTTATYRPDRDFAGADAFTFTAADGKGGKATATVTVTVTPVNDAPRAVDAVVSVTEDTPRTWTLQASDPDKDALTHTVAAKPVHGTVTIAKGVATYVPDRHFAGSDSFGLVVTDPQGLSDTAKVSLLVAAVNDAPTVTPWKGTALSGVPREIPLVAADPENDALTRTVAVKPKHGTATATGGRITYTAAAPFTGTDSFRVRVSDGRGGSATTTVTLEVGVPPMTLTSAVGAVGQTFRTASTTPFKVTWGRSTDPAGTTYDVRWRPAGGEWAPWVSGAGRSATFGGSGAPVTPLPGSSYDVEVSAVDVFGRRADPVETTATLAQDDRAGVAGGGWKRTTSSGRWLGTVTSTTKRAAITFSATGRRVSLVGDRSRRGSRFAVYVGRAKVGTYSSYAASTRARQVLWSRTFSTAASRTVRVVSLPTRGRPQLVVDGFESRP